jgi:GT2 family glycosyltransferase
MAKNSIVECPEIDLSLVTFNSAKWIADFFASLRAQSYPLDRIHVFVRDNGSTDETLHLLDELRAEDICFASVQVESGDNVGFGKGHNANLARGKSPYFFVSNLDLTFEKEAIARIVTQALADDVSIASWELRQKPFEHPKYYDPVSMLTSWSSGACVLFRRQAIMSVGGFEPRIFMYGEDVELSYRLRASGFKLKYCPEAVCWHYSYGAAEEVKPLQFLGSKLGNAYIRLRYGSWWQILVILPLFIAALLLPTRFSGQRKGIFKTLVRLFANAPYFLSTRLQNQTVSFPLNYFDFETPRAGAFFENRALPTVLPLVTVVMLFRKGRQQFFRNTISTVLNQTYPKIQLLIVDDEGQLESDIVQDLLVHGEVESIEYVHLAEKDPSMVDSLVLPKVLGEYMCVLNDASLLFADHVEVLLQEVLKGDHAGAIGQTALCRIKNDNKGKFGSGDDGVFYNGTRLTESGVENFIKIQSIMLNMRFVEENSCLRDFVAFKQKGELSVKVAEMFNIVRIPKLTSLFCEK